MSITRLSQNTAKRLTTAQVVTSVFSAVKELVENSIDAGANNIEVTLEEQGLSFIEVRDNGKGIPSADSAFIALQAYTSKLTDFSDLESLETYGFRGEALSALCRVSDVKIITKTEQDDAARCYTMHHNGSIQKAEYCARQMGTTVQAQSLFKNLPVRRKIISAKKQAKQDVKAIESLLQNFGVCHPHIRIAYKVDDINVFVKAPTTTIKDSLTTIFDRKLTSNSEFLNFESPDVHVDLTIPKKDIEHTQLSTICQKFYSHIYINSRPVAYPEFENMIVKALSTHFSDKIPAKKKPMFFLIIKVPLSDIDVNLEPNKTKVLLKNGQEILQTVKTMLVDYYEISESEELISQAPTAENESSPVHSSTCLDSTGNAEDLEPESPFAKTRKIQRTKSKATVGNKMIRLDINNKENESANNEATEHESSQTKVTVTTLSEEETLSQLPKVDLGEDFSTQDIRMIPTLEPHEVEAVMNEMFQSETDAVLESHGVKDVINEMVQAEVAPIASTSKTSETEIQLTESQWSRGHGMNIKGGTGVAILGPSGVSGPKKKKETLHLNADPSNRGFLKFSAQIRRQIIDENPQLNLVEIAKLVSERWKQLTPDEREHYRELDRQDISLSNSKLNSSSGGQKRKLKVSPEDLENNKKKMLNMMEHMKMRKPTEKNPNALMKVCVPWEIDINTVIENCQKKSQSLKNCSIIIGSLNDKISIARTNAQIWMLSLDHLFEGLNLNESEREECKGNSELIQTYFKRWLVEKDNTNSVGMYPIYELD